MGIRIYLLISLPIWILNILLSFFLLFPPKSSSPAKKPKGPRSRTIVELEKEAGGKVPRTYSEIAESRLARIPKSRRHLRRKAYQAMGKGITERHSNFCERN